jgi:hypothetical protein
MKALMSQPPHRNPHHTKNPLYVPNQELVHIKDIYIQVLEHLG